MPNNQTEALEKQIDSKTYYFFLKIGDLTLSQQVRKSLLTTTTKKTEVIGC